MGMGRWVRNGLRGAVTAALGVGLLSGPVRAQTPAMNGPEPRWVVYYSDQEPASAFEPYTHVVLDSHHHPPLRPLLDRGKQLYGYISLGEVESQRPWFQQVKALGVLRQENANWPGSFYVDLRDKRWTRMVVEDLIPSILHKRFQGLFLDTLDNAGELEELDPKGNAGMVKAAVSLVKAIHHHYPNIKLIMNRGYDLLPQLASVIDGALGESVYTSWDFKAGKANIRPNTEYQIQVEILQGARKRNPNLMIMTLDYWDANDRPGVAHIYEIERRNGFLPYVATIALDRIIPEPAPTPPSSSTAPVR